MYRVISNAPEGRSLSACEHSGIFNPDFQQVSKSTKQIVMGHMLNSFMGHFPLSCRFKTTDVGIVDHDEGVEFIGVLRKLYENLDPVFLFLHRPAEECADSMLSSELFHELHHQPREAIIEVVRKQEDVFRRSSILGDVHITYKQLCEDPIKILNWLDVYPKHDTLQERIGKIIEKKIR